MINETSEIKSLVASMGVAIPAIAIMGDWVALQGKVLSPCIRDLDLRRKRRAKLSPNLKATQILRKMSILIGPPLRTVTVPVQVGRHFGITDCTPPTACYFSARSAPVRHQKWTNHVGYFSGKEFKPTDVERRQKGYIQPRRADTLLCLWYRKEASACRRYRGAKSCNAVSDTSFVRF